MTIFPKEFNIKVLIQDALDRKIIWHVHFWFDSEKKVINYRRAIDRNENIFRTHRRDIYHAKLDMPRNQMVSVPRSTPVLFKVLRFVWANVHEQLRIRPQTFFIWNMLRRQIKRYNETCINYSLPMLEFFPF